MRVLFILSQRPELTGSGTTLDALVRESIAAGHEPWVLCGVPAGRPIPSVSGLPPDRVMAVTFAPGTSEGDSRQGPLNADLPFAVPGMSDVMPYASTVWSSMTGAQLEQYRRVWRASIENAITACRPDVVHCNHLWLVASLLSDVLHTETGAVHPPASLVHCHATGLRQMELCPHLRHEIIARVRRHNAFLVPQTDLARRVAATLDVPPSKVINVGAGYRQDLFHSDGAAQDSERSAHVLYVGKYAVAKGLPCLLDTCMALWREGERFTLHVVGDGSGEEAESLRTRMASLASSSIPASTKDPLGTVIMHGRLDQGALGGLMRRVGTLVLPSFFEGLPLVLVEARACGCRLVSTTLEGVVTGLAPSLGPDMILVKPPPLAGPDTPVASALPGFTGRLSRALRDAMRKGPAGPASDDLLTFFTWNAVFRRVESIWQKLVPNRSAS